MAVTAQWINRTDNPWGTTDITIILSNNGVVIYRQDKNYHKPAAQITTQFLNQEASDIAQAVQDLRNKESVRDGIITRRQALNIIDFDNAVLDSLIAAESIAQTRAALKDLFAQRLLKFNREILEAIAMLKAGL